MINLPIIFSKIFSLAVLTRLRFISHLEMKPCNVLYQLHLYFCFFLHFWVIISDRQLPKFTENTHKIAQNCVCNVQKLFAEGGWQINGGGG